MAYYWLRPVCRLLLATCSLATCCWPSTTFSVLLDARQLAAWSRCVLLAAYARPPMLCRLPLGRLEETGWCHAAHGWARLQSSSLGACRPQGASLYVARRLSLQTADSVASSPIESQCPPPSTLMGARARSLGAASSHAGGVRASAGGARPAASPSEVLRPHGSRFPRSRRPLHSVDWATALLAHSPNRLALAWLASAPGGPSIAATCAR